MDIQASKKIPLLDIDVKGSYKFAKAFPESIVLAVVPPSVDDLKKRLLGRGTETE
jgi:guanylate kinase